MFLFTLCYFNVIYIIYIQKANKTMILNINILIITKKDNY